LVVGVVGDFRQFNIDTPARPEMFLPARQFPEMTLVTRTAADPVAILSMLRQSVAQIDKDEPLSDVQTLQQMVDHSKFNMLLLSGFAGLSVVLALLGIYGLISYTISSRTRDIGIRLTLGAQRKHILITLVLQILPFVTAGIVTGLGLSLLTQKLIAKLLFGIRTLDPGIYVGLPIVLLAVALAICAVPAWRAARLEPVNVLRHE
jgi:putative ABC transport system permease protein